MIYKKTTFLPIIILIIALLITGCGSKPAQNSDNNLSKKQIYQHSDLNPKLVEAYNKFALNLYKLIYKKDKGENMMISPTSIATALSMTLNGAKGETLTEMLTALELNGLSVDEINKSNQILLNLLQTSDPSVEISIANSLWIREGSIIHEAFTQVNEEYYHAEAQSLDFSDSKSVDTINRWVKESTRNKIDGIVSAPIPDDVLLYLINAIYFNGEWTHSFKEHSTSDEIFTLRDGTEKTVPMMKESREREYLKSKDFEAIRLPYGEDEQWNMIVVLPNKKTDFDQLYNKILSNPTLWTEGYEQKLGQLELPRFRMEYEVGLIPVLKALGMEVPFNETKADFSGIASNPPHIFISDVKHKTFIEVNEKGTEAAAVTSIEAGITSLPSYEYQMVVNRPFYFAIEDRSTGVIMFMGMVENP